MIGLVFAMGLMFLALLATGTVAAAVVVAALIRALRQQAREHRDRDAVRRGEVLWLKQILAQPYRPEASS